MPHVLYLFHTISTTFLQDQLTTLQRILNTFIWNGKHPRVWRCILYAPTNVAVIGTPEVKQYYRAILLDQFKRWWSSSLHHLWVQIEEVTIGCSTKQLLAALWLQLKLPHFYLSMVNTTIKALRSILQTPQGIPKSLLMSLPLTAFNLLCLVIDSWVTAGLPTI